MLHLSVFTFGYYYSNFCPILKKPAVTLKLQKSIINSNFIIITAVFVRIGQRFFTQKENVHYLKKRILGNSLSNNIAK